VLVEAADRRRYCQLADPEVATLIEALERLAPTLPVSSLEGEGGKQSLPAFHGDR
jgi:hypothetical protein